MKGLRSINKSNRKKRGIALIMVLLVVVVLVTLAGGFAANMKVEAVLARNMGSERDLDWVCRSGVELARYLVGQQMSIALEPYDSLNQRWAGGPGGQGSTNAVFSGISLSPIEGQSALMDFLSPDENNGVSVKIEIVDMERRFNLNRVADKLFGRRFAMEKALEFSGCPNVEVGGIVDSVWDWFDADSSTGLNGAESSQYQDMGYVAKNGPFDDLSELLLLKGMRPEWFYGTKGNMEKTLRGRGPMLVDDEYRPGMEELFSTVSSGYININTASEYVLQLLESIDRPLAQAIIRIRAGADEIDGTDDDQPFRAVAELANVGFTRNMILDAQNLLSVRSTVFEVKVTAQKDGRKRVYVALFYRVSPTDVKILHSHWN